MERRARLGGVLGRRQGGERDDARRKETASSDSSSSSRPPVRSRSALCTAVTRAPLEEEGTQRRRRRQEPRQRHSDLEELEADVGEFDFLEVLVLEHGLEGKEFFVGQEGFFGDGFDEGLDGHGHAFLRFGGGAEVGVEDGDAVGEHGDLEAELVEEEVDELLQREVGSVQDVDGVPDGPGPLLAGAAAAGDLGDSFFGRLGLGEGEERERQVREAALQIFDLELRRRRRPSQFDEFEADQAGDEGGGGGDGRDDLAGD
mmetsp:Transcript_1647/g.4921  ORF Transcript_1647/g.4921 Transcript_1647/m.4921 type:complete len:259 (-) Transcript_1647:1240-2016(-)